MFYSRLRSCLPVLAATAIGWVIVAAPASAQASASVAVEPELVYKITSLTVSGTATCGGGGTAGVDVVDGSLEQMFQGGIGGPIAIRLDGPVLLDCDGVLHRWSGHLIAPGRALPNQSGGSLTATLTQGSAVIATTGPQPVRIVG